MPFSKENQLTLSTLEINQTLLLLQLGALLEYLWPPDDILQHKTDHKAIKEVIWDGACFGLSCTWLAAAENSLTEQNEKQSRPFNLKWYKECADLILKAPLDRKAAFHHHPQDATKVNTYLSTVHSDGKTTQEKLTEFVKKISLIQDDNKLCHLSQLFKSTSLLAEDMNCWVSNSYYFSTKDMFRYIENEKIVKTSISPVNQAAFTNLVSFLEKLKDGTYGVGVPNHFYAFIKLEGSIYKLDPIHKRVVIYDTKTDMEEFAKNLAVSVNPVNSFLEFDAFSIHKITTSAFHNKITKKSAIVDIMEPSSHLFNLALHYDDTEIANSIWKHLLASGKNIVHCLSGAIATQNTSFFIRILDALDKSNDMFWEMIRKNILCQLAYTAIKTDSQEIFFHLLEKKVPLEAAVNGAKINLLYAAVKYNKPKIVDALLQLPALNPNEPHKKKHSHDYLKTPLFIGLDRGHLDLAHKLLDDPRLQIDFSSAHNPLLALSKMKIVDRSLVEKMLHVAEKNHPDAQEWFLRAAKEANNLPLVQTILTIKTAEPIKPLTYLRGCKVVVPLPTPPVKDLPTPPKAKPN